MNSVFTEKTRSKMITKVIAYVFGVMTCFIISGFLYGFFKAVWKDLKDNRRV